MKAGPVRGMAEEGGGSRPRPEKGRQSWQYVGGLDPCAALGVGGR